MCLLALPTMGKASIWFDEAFSAYISHFSFADIAKYTALDVHPPVYYWLLKLWQIPFGSTATSVRSLSLVFAGIAVIFGFLLVRRLFGRKAAVLSLLFMMLSPMLLRYSREARMYTLDAAIVLAATYTYVVALKSRRWAPWIVYGLLVTLGMWTHYFTVFAWLSHWLWRLTTLRQQGKRGRALWRAYFSKQWLVAYGLAVVIFLPWVPVMMTQLGGIQTYGFWIGSVGVDTPVNYLTNFFYYQENNNVGPWGSVFMWAAVIGIVALAVRLYRKLSPSQKQSYLLLVFMATVPVALLIIASLPPLRPSYVERYLMPSLVSGALLLAVTLVYGMAKAKVWWRIGAIVGLSLVFIAGIQSVYYFGNYNKNTGTHSIANQLIASIDKKAAPGEPIIANSPWIFYEAVFYDTKAHPIYFIDADTTYQFGSLAMLKDSNQHKITNTTTFFRHHPKVWYFGVTTNSTVQSSRTNGWTALRTVSVYDPLNQTTSYKATEYKTN